MMSVSGTFGQYTKIISISRFFFPDHSATSQILSDLAFCLAAEGRAVHIITSRQRYEDPEADLPACEAIRDVQVHRVFTSHFGRTFLLGRALDYMSFYVTAVWGLWRLARPGDVIVAEIDPPLLSVAVAPVARGRRARLVTWLQDLFPEVASALGR
jgi:hypothetical protein